MVLAFAGLSTTTTFIRSVDLAGEEPSKRGLGRRRESGGGPLGVSTDGEKLAAGAGAYGAILPFRTGAPTCGEGGGGVWDSAGFRLSGHGTRSRQRARSGVRS